MCSVASTENDGDRALCFAMPGSEWVNPWNNLGHDDIRSHWEMNNEQESSDGESHRRAAEQIEQGIEHLKNERSEQAVDSFTAAIRLCPALANAYFARACAYAHRGEMERALADCTEVLRLNPEGVNAYRLRGEIYGKTGRWANAERDLAKAKGLESRRG